MNIHERSHSEEGTHSRRRRKESATNLRAQREESIVGASYEAHQSFGKKGKDGSVDVIILVPEEEKKDFHSFPKEKKSLLPRFSPYVFFLALGTAAASLAVLGPMAKTIEAYQYGMMPEFIPLDWGMLGFVAMFAFFLVVRGASRSNSSSRVTGHARRKIFEEREEKESF